VEKQRELHYEDNDTIIVAGHLSSFFGPLSRATLFFDSQFFVESKPQQPEAKREGGSHRAGSLIRL
jgi:hypothetical protein